MAEIYFLVERHPNGGYAAVQNTYGAESRAEATKKHRRFTTPYEALEYGNTFFSQGGCHYGTEVAREILTRPSRLGTTRK